MCIVFVQQYAACIQLFRVYAWCIELHNDFYTNVKLHLHGRLFATRFEYFFHKKTLPEWLITQGETHVWQELPPCKLTPAISDIGCRLRLS